LISRPMASFRTAEIIAINHRIAVAAVEIRKESYRCFKCNS
jgi:hypothetical protein